MLRERNYDSAQWDFWGEMRNFFDTQIPKHGNFYFNDDGRGEAKQSNWGGTGLLGMV